MQCVPRLSNCFGGSAFQEIFGFLNEKFYRTAQLVNTEFDKIIGYKKYRKCAFSLAQDYDCIDRILDDVLLPRETNYHGLAKKFYRSHPGGQMNFLLALMLEELKFCRARIEGCLRENETIDLVQLSNREWRSVKSLLFKTDANARVIEFSGKCKILKINSSQISEFEELNLSREIIIHIHLDNGIRYDFKTFPNANEIWLSGPGLARSYVGWQNTCKKICIKCPNEDVVIGDGFLSRSSRLECVEISAKSFKTGNLFLADCESLTSFIVKSGVATEVGRSFMEGAGIADIDFSFMNGVERIDDNFCRWSKLRKVNLSNFNNLVQIGAGFCKYTRDLEQVSIDAPNLKGVDEDFCYGSEMINDPYFLHQTTEGKWWIKRAEPSIDTTPQKKRKRRSKKNRSAM